jgi:predicted Mrr-cat superfamily restriction endonuclease
VRSLYEAAYPQDGAGKTTNAVTVLYKFRSVLQSGDKIVTYVAATVSAFLTAGFPRADQKTHGEEKHFTVATKTLAFTRQVMLDGDSSLGKTS